MAKRARLYPSIYDGSSEGEITMTIIDPKPQPEPQEPPPHQGWVVTLNNGEMTFEQPPKEKERTSWQKLLQRCREETIMKPIFEIRNKRKVKVGEEEVPLQITSLRLQRGGLNIHALSQKQCEGYFQAYEYRLKSLFNPKKGSVQSQGIGSVVGDKVYIFWINPMGQIHQDIRPLEGSKIHTTLS